VSNTEYQSVIKLFSGSVVSFVMFFLSVEIKLWVTDNEKKKPHSSDDWKRWSIQ